MYKLFSHGHTVNRKTDSTTPRSLSRQQNFTYPILIRKIYFPKTQDFLRPRFYSSFNTFWMTDGYSADIIAYEIVSMLKSVVG